MKVFWDRFAAIGGGVFGSVKSIHGFFFLNIDPVMADMMPELVRAFMFGFIGGFAGWAAKKSGDSLIFFINTRIVRKPKSKIDDTEKA